VITVRCRTSRLIGLLYWTAWLCAGVAVATVFAAAAWILPRHVAPLSVALFAALFVCAACSLFLLSRSARQMGRGRLARTAPRAGWVVLIVLAALGAFAMCPFVKEAARSRDWADLPVVLAEWGRLVVVFQVLAFAFVVEAALASAWMVWRLTGACRGFEARPRRRLAAVLLVACVAMGALPFGGYELVRRAGMATFVATFDTDLRGHWMRRYPSSGTCCRDVSGEGDDISGCCWRGRRLVHEVYDEPRKHVLVLRTPDGVWWTPAFFRARDYRALIPPKPPESHDRERLPDYLVDVGIPGTIRRTVWGEWQEYGPTLTFSLPWPGGG